MNAIIADSRPFNDFRKKGMRDFLQTAVSEDCTIWSSTDIIVDKYTGKKTITVFINQYAQTSKGSTMRIGVLSFEILKKTQLFVVNQLAINNYTEHFQVHSAALGCVKREDDSAIQLLNYVRNLSNEIDQNFYRDQR
ncbi:unnamed protein product [Adineta steineri]|uniref:Uncharacterized protein n=1 Tax=Adineta steineri TaxID=433720 RepID=A0A814ZQV5_9BILA|nr:unnamed protein product [Adineta steineri]